MITLQTLRLQDFMNISSLDLDFTDSVINVFSGPNGSGKSAFMEAIAICFTERRRGDSYKDFIKHGNTEASIYLEACVYDKPIKFEIKIVDKVGSTPFHRKITYNTITYQNSECAELLQSFEIDYLQYIMFSLQGENNITELRPADRAKVLKRIFKYEFDNQLAQIDAILIADQQALQTATIQLDIQNKRTFTYAPEKEILPLESRAEKEARLSILRKEESDYLKGRLQIKDLLYRRDLNFAKVRELDSRRIEKTREKLASQASLETLKVDLSKYQLQTPQLSSIETKKQSIVEKQNKIVRYLATKEILTQECVLQKTESQELQQELFSLSSKIIANEKGTCSECGQSTHPEEVPLLKEIQLKSQDIANQKNAQIAKTERQLVELEKKLIEHNHDIQSLTREIPQIQQAYNQFEELITRTTSLVTAAETALQQKTTEITSIDKQLLDEKEEGKLLVSQIALLNTSEEKDFTIIKTIEKLLADDDIQLAVNITIRTANQLIADDEVNNNKLIAKLTTQKAELATKITDYTSARQILEIHLSNYIIVKACAKLEKMINEFIADIKPGMTVKLFQNRKGVEFFYSPTGTSVKLEDWLSTKMASGFEKELLSIAWRVALAKAYKLSILMLDEIDSAAAVQTSETLFRKLANLTDFQQLFIISHKPEVVDILLQEQDAVVSYTVFNGIFSLQS